MVLIITLYIKVVIKYGIRVWRGMEGTLSAALKAFLVLADTASQTRVYGTWIVPKK